MITVSFDLKDKKAARIFGQAMIDYSDDGEETPAKGMQDMKLKGDEAPVVLPPNPEPPQGGQDPEPVAPAIHGGGTGEPPVVVEAAPAIAGSGFDENGVPFNADFCGKAKVPFYGSGKHKGQWKRKQKVDVNTYDAWYAGEHIKVQSGPATQVTPVAPNTAAAFGGGVPEPVEDDTPQGAGELMKWISEQMNAKHLTQGDVDSGYATAGVTPADLFSGDADAVKGLYDVLTAVIAA